MIATAATVAAMIVLTAVLGPGLTDRLPSATVGTPFSASTSAYPLGTDVLGRDVLARLLHGGRLVVGVAVGATLLATALSAAFGVLVALSAKWMGELATRMTDTVAVLPALLVVLLLAASFPGSDLAVLAAVTVTTVPFSARVVRSAARRVIVQSYTETARARGDSTWHVVRRDIAPNIAGVVFADAGVRFAGAVSLTATAGFLGLGSRSGAPNWGRMVAENLPGSELAVLPVLAPALVLVLFVLVVNLLADELASRIGRLA
ncbi:ABC transporter permease [Tenggerimyces flavus]|uniref:ABC transporter permease n=1 Tax=Tenggerimyces flavus TaxID=1708749 RepID=A0ABV7YNP2_9ACTN|nr:ABC transporter permease subunit [Tenggerimyces flavus]MBM7790129.1 peptide/nickel transport system permease protein [Tenggerimyces flavus]